MFGKIGHFVVRHPWYTILAWIVAAGALLAFAPAFEASSEQTDFLPDKYESVQAFDLAEEAFPGADGQTALIVATHSDEAALSAEDEDAVDSLVTTLTEAEIEGIASIEAGPVSENGKVQIINVGFTSATFGDEEVYEAVDKLREEIADDEATSELTVRVTGAAATGRDSQEAFEKSDQITFIATIVVIFLLLLVTFRSPVAAVMPILTVILVMMVAFSLIDTVNEIFDLTADQTTQSIMPIVLFGVGTDYILFLLFRYRESLRAGEGKKKAMVTAVRRVGEVIASAAGAVIVAFTVLVFASLGMLKSMGPAMAIGVATTLLAALTLIPAVVSLIGPKVFWPSKAWRVRPNHPVSRRIGRALSRRPIAFALGSVIVLGALSFAAFNFNPSFDLASAPEGTEAAQGIEDMKKGFPLGALDATQVFLRSTDGQPLTQSAIDAEVEALENTNGVGTVVPFDEAEDLSEDGTVASLMVQLAENPQSDAAMDAVDSDIRPAAHEAAPEGTEAVVGGTTAIFVDLEDSMNRDYRVIFPIAGALIAIILALLLRSLVAPIYLLVAVVLTFAATIGSATLIFQELQGHTGLLFFLPLVIYLFVVALGTDYNILMIARLREEAREGHGPQEALERAFPHAAPTIASAGLILAGSFGTFLLAQADFLQEMGVSVALGIALAAFVMSMFLVPAVTRIFGHGAWWPGHGDVAQKKGEQHVG